MRTLKFCITHVIYEYDYSVNGNIASASLAWVDFLKNDITRLLKWMFIVVPIGCCETCIIFSFFNAKIFLNHLRVTRFIIYQTSTKTENVLSITDRENYLISFSIAN